MMCYRDMTFCSYDDCKLFKKCDRALTDKVLEDAHKWWGTTDAPIAYYGEKPDCWEEKRGTKK